jgi:ADP-ribose pyrophosphatase YjhB (NUDIX family)
MGSGRLTTTSAEDQPPRPQVAVGAVAVAGDALLLVKRGNPPERGRWTIPGGRVQAGESLAQAVERELAEETGLHMRCGSFVGFAERMGPGYHFVILDFETVGDAQQRGTPIAGGDALEAVWVPLEAVPMVDLVTGLEGFLREHGVLQ